MRPACDRSVAILAAVALLRASVAAISVIAPTFQELVAEAQTVFVGEVTATQTLWTGTGTQRTIVTNVTFAVESTLKGTGASVRVLRFLGGTVDDQTLRVPGMPTFKVGDRAVLFVTNDVNAISPLVGVMHGRFPGDEGERRARVRRAPRWPRVLERRPGRPVGGDCEPRAVDAHAA